MIKKHYLMRVLLVAAFTLVSALSQALTPADSSSYKAQIEQFFAPGLVRLPGSAGNAAIAAKVGAQFAASGFAHGTTDFVAPAFVAGNASLTIDAESFTLHALHPSLLNPGNFAHDRFQAPLVYLGKGSISDLAAVSQLDLDGAIAVMDFDCGRQWLRVLRFGVQGIIFIEPAQYRTSEAHAKIHNSEVGVPRYLLPRQQGLALRQRLQDAASRQQSLVAQFEVAPSVWENQLLQNHWVFIPGSDPGLQRDVIVMTAPLDSNAVVPALAEGGKNGANLFLLMQLLEKFRQQPPARSVMLVAVNAHTQGLLGERVLSWFLLAPPGRIEGIRNQINNDIRRQQIYLEQYNKIELEPPTPETAQLLIDFRMAEDRSTGRSIRIKDALVDLARRDVNLVKGRKLAVQNQDISNDAKQRQLAALDLELEKYVRVLTLFNRVGVQTQLMPLPNDPASFAEQPNKYLDGEEINILRGYVDNLRADFSTWIALNEQELARNLANNSIRQVLDGRSVRLIITLEQLWSGSEVGFMSSGNWSMRLGNNTVRIANEVAGVDQRIFLDTMTNYGGLSQDYFFPVAMTSLDPFGGVSTAAVALKTAFRDAGTMFTPADRFADLDAEVLETLMPFFLDYLPALIADSEITKSNQLPRPNFREPIWSIRLKSFKFDTFSASVMPEMPVPNTLLLLHPEHQVKDVHREDFRQTDVINRHFTLTDARAAGVIYGLTFRMAVSLDAIQYDPQFRQVRHMIDAGDAHEKAPSNISPGEQRVLSLFEVDRSFPIWARGDSSRLGSQPLQVNNYLILEGVQGSSPRQYGVLGMKSTLSSKMASNWIIGPAAVYMAENTTLKILTDKKNAVLNATAADPLGTGFSNAQQLGNDFFAVAANDMNVLNRHRLTELRGVSNELVDEFLRRSAAADQQLQQATHAHDYPSYLQALYEKIGSQAKAYAQISGITNDMLKAIVFYMALLLPFCFFVQKLVFKFVRLEAQLAMFAGLFVITFTVFRNIHPAFKVAQAPEAIFIGFIMGVLAMFVISILHGRFEGEMQLLFMSYSGMDASEVGYSTVGQKAMLIGVNNMKRRRIRTSLTTATIILVTFTMLAFSSVSKKMSPTVVPVSRTAPYAGIFYQWPGNQCMDEESVLVFQELVYDVTDQSIIRRWLMPAGSDAQGLASVFHLRRRSGESSQIEGILGLDPAEDGFLESMPLLPGSRFFSTADAAEAILPASAAGALGLEAGDVGTILNFNGHQLQLVGIVDDDRLRALRDLNDRPILPVKESSKGAQSGSNTAAATDTNSPDDGSGVFYVETSTLLLLPINFAQQLGAKPYSVSVRLREDIDLWSALERIMTSTSARFYVGSSTGFTVGSEGKRQTQAGVYYIGSGFRTSIGGLSRLIIPLLIAATIILNTMLGAVYERKSEIAVYNAIGLNPTHIGLFFLAEAFVYSVIGSVGGYLIGQLMTIGMTRLQIVEGLNLNFSSLSVVYVILFTIAVVLLSTIYPARVATREAVPSGKHKWSMPPLDGNVMKVVFPFIYQPVLAPAIMAYLREYFATFTEASVGELIASDEGIDVGTDASDRQTYSLSYTLALAPFDLGVTQRALFRCEYDDIVQSYRIHLLIDRTSGQDSNWMTVNKPFLEKLRQFLMHWRNLPETKHAYYRDLAAGMFGALALPSSTDATAAEKLGIEVPTISK